VAAFCDLGRLSGDMRDVLEELKELFDNCLYEVSGPVAHSPHASARRSFYRRCFGEPILELTLEDVSPKVEVLIFKRSNTLWGNEYTVTTCGLSEAGILRGCELLLRFDEFSWPSGSFEDSASFRYLERAISFLLENYCEPYEVFTLDGVEYPEREDGLFSHAVVMPTRHELSEVRTGILGASKVRVLDIEFLTSEEAAFASLYGVHSLLGLMQEFDHSRYFRLHRGDYAKVFNFEILGGN
jgi:hypothetical protein